MNLAAKLAKKLWRMDLTADLAKKTWANWTEFAEKTVALNASAIDEMEAWHARAIQVETSVNPSAKRLHTIISEMDAPLGGT